MGRWVFKEGAYLREEHIWERSLFKQRRILGRSLFEFGYRGFLTLAPTIWNTLPTEIQALAKLEEFKTKVGKIDLAWCSCQKCCDKQKSNKIHNMVSTNYTKCFTNGPWEGGMGIS